uniref:Immunoglobulin V-set domain-containing protein n=1 Tax=Paramormyrops kingsleyae TaxID=1676925 RepID=A0A3B3QRP7_9TELE
MTPAVSRSRQRLLYVSARRSALSVDKQEVTGVEEDRVSVQCRYGNNESQVMWCKIRGSCASEGSGSLDGRPVLIRDDTINKVFSVTMRGLERKDTGWYWCAAGNLRDLWGRIQSRWVWSHGEQSRTWSHEGRSGSTVTTGGKAGTTGGATGMGISGGTAGATSTGTTGGGAGAVRSGTSKGGAGAAGAGTTEGRLETTRTGAGTAGTGTTGAGTVAGGCASGEVGAASPAEEACSILKWSSLLSIFCTAGSPATCQ